MIIFRYLAALTCTLFIVLIALDPAESRSVVNYKKISKGEIVIKTSKRRLYLGLGNGKAISYPVGVGRSGKQWTGARRIRSKRIKPAWRPTKQIRRDKPNIANVVRGGSAKNPMGAAALVLSGRGQFAIHGTNNPRSIGGFVSYGCIRMHNRDIMDVYSRVRIGTKVFVTK